MLNTSTLFSRASYLDVTLASYNQDVVVVRGADGSSVLRLDGDVHPLRRHLAWLHFERRAVGALGLAVPAGALAAWLSPYHAEPKVDTYTML